MSEANDDTVPGESANDDTLVASTSEPGAATPLPRIRPSRPTLPPSTRDYPQLTVVDPALYLGPQRRTVYFQRMADTATLEYACSAEHWLEALEKNRASQ